jgi:TetR/AcrR family transcriptional regulator, mexJK operon transcriptional repressor
MAVPPDIAPSPDDAALRGRPKDEHKRAALIEAAQKLFLEKGFDGASIDRIAAEAGVAKVTVYSHFGGKDQLFADAVRAKCDSFMSDAALEAITGPTVDARLQKLGRLFLDLILDSQSTDMHRLVTADGPRHPAIAQSFLENAILATCLKVKIALEREVAVGALEIDDTMSASGHFLALMKGLPQMKAMMGLSAGTPEELDAHVASAAGVFARAYAPRLNHGTRSPDQA